MISVAASNLTRIIECPAQRHFDCASVIIESSIALMLRKMNFTSAPWATGATFIEINTIASVKSPLHEGAHLVRFPAPHLAELI